MEDRLIDIFVVTYNRANYLEQSIRSILKQTYSQFRLTILDNCSNDNTKEVVMSIEDSRINYVRHANNIGGVGNINYAITHAKCKYFMIFHDDDIMYDNLIKTQLEVMENNPELSIVSCKSDIIDMNGGVSYNNVSTGILEKFDKGNFFLNYLYNHGFILFPAIMYRTEFMQKYKIMIEEKIGPSADVFMCFEIERNQGVIGILNQSLMAYRRHSEQDSYKNRVQMIVQLFRGMKNDSYYRDILNSNISGQNAYYKWLMHNEVCMVAKDQIECKAARMAQNKYESVLAYKRVDHILYKIIIWDEEHLRVSKLLYKWLKRGKDASKNSKSE